MCSENVSLMKRLLYIIIGVALLFAACDGHYGERRQQLLELQARNRADSLMHDDSLARALVDYFDRHGTPNDRLLSRYLLGRTYADLGQTPQALEAYHDAADQADTTQADCDFATLGRVYAQMSDIFYYQNLMQDYLTYLDYAIKYAWQARDTMMALNESAYRLLAFDKMGETDSVIINFRMLFQQFKQVYGVETAAKYCVFPVKSLISKGEIAEAGEYLKICESASGYFDSQGNVERGRESYYYYKGLYYLAVHKLDSAEIIFRKQLEADLNFENQAMAAHGLSLVFSRIGRPDSAAKYAIYYGDMNDSVYAKMATHEVEQMQAMYDYSCFQNQAIKEKAKADVANRNVWLLICVIVVLGVCAMWLYSYLSRERRDAFLKYQEKVKELASLKEDMSKLLSDSESLSQFVKEKADKVQHIEAELKNLKVNNSTLHKEEKRLLKNHEEYKAVMKKLNSGKILDSDEWAGINFLIGEELPGFLQFMNSHVDELDYTEQCVCMLLRLHFRIKDTGTLIGLSGSRISQISDSILSKLFGCKGGGKELSRRLRDII